MDITHSGDCSQGAQGISTDTDQERGLVKSGGIMILDGQDDVSGTLPRFEKKP